MMILASSLFILYNSHQTNYSFRKNKKNTSITESIVQCEFLKIDFNVSKSCLFFCINTFLVFINEVCKISMMLRITSTPN